MSDDVCRAAFEANELHINNYSPNAYVIWQKSWQAATVHARQDAVAPVVDVDDGPMWAFKDNDELLSHFSFLWDEYALAKNETLSQDARELKQKLLGITGHLRQAQGLPRAELEKVRDDIVNTQKHFEANKDRFRKAFLNDSLAILDRLLSATEPQPETRMENGDGLESLLARVGMYAHIRPPFKGHPQWTVSFNAGGEFKADTPSAAIMQALGKMKEAE